MNSEHVLIIGGTHGSGRTLVKRLLKKGVSISILGRHASPEVMEKPKGLHFYNTDLKDVNDTQETIKKIINKSGKLSHIVFYQRFRGNDDDWYGEYLVSLTATKNIIEQCANQFDDSNNKSIVIIGSSANTFIHSEQPLSYHVAKAGLKQLMRYFAVTLGPNGIRVNCVSPSTVIKEESRQFYSEQTELRELYEKITPLKRMGYSEDIADVVEYLCSSKSSFITGQDIIVDGGLSLVGHASLARDIDNLTDIKITRN